MTLEDLHEALAERAPGLAAFEEFIQDCEQGMAAAPEHAAFYSLLANAAQRFRDRYSQAPLGSDVSKAARDKLLDLVDKARRAATADAGARLKILNAIALADLG